MRKQGFTVIEVIVVSAFLVTAGVVLLFQLQRMNTEHVNSQKKVAINAIYYSLEESFFPANQFYPESIDKDTLKTMDASLLTDPDGHALGDSESAYRYEPKNCKDGKCAAYSLRAILENEEDFVKTNR
jgi:type II secretory pathway pseudopilin PulG